MQQAVWSISAVPGLAPSRDNASVCHAVASNTLYMFGGCDKTGTATNTLYKLDLSALPQSTWELLECAGEQPPPRWGHSSFLHANKLWVYGGSCDNSKRTGKVDQLYSLDLSTKTWVKAEQTGCLPDRDWANHKQQTFKAAVVSGTTMLAFGKEPQDENSKPTNTKPAKPATCPALRLHAFDLLSSSWSSIPTAGSICFDHLEALLLHEHKLLCVGWSWPPAGTKAECHMQVCCLDLGQHACRTTPAAVSPPPRRTPTAFTLTAPRSLRSRSSPCWTTLAVCKGSITPTARVGCAVAVLGQQLIMHGGMLCSLGLQGKLTAATLCLDLPSMTWQELDTTQQKARGSSSSVNVPRVSHAAVPVPASGAVLLVGGTASRSAHASCTVMECLRITAAANPAGPAAATAAAAAAAAAAATTAAGGMGVGGTKQQGTKQGTAPQRAATPPRTAAGADDDDKEHVNLCSTRGKLMPNATPMAAGQATPAVFITPTSSVAAAATPAGAGSLPQSSLLPAYDFSAYVCHEALSDVELVAGDVTFPAHRLLLCQSDLLRELLSKAVSSQQQALQCRWKLHLNDIYPDVLKLLLQYMYGALEGIPVDAAPLLFKASDRYGLPGLRATCLSVLVGSINLDTVTAYALLAHDHSCDELTQACVEFTAASSERFLQVLGTSGYLHLNQINPRAGQAFLQQAMQHLNTKTTDV